MPRIARVLFSNFQLDAVAFYSINDEIAERNGDCQRRLDDDVDSVFREIRTDYMM